MTTRTDKQAEPLLIFGMMNRLGVDPAGGVLPQSALRYEVAQQNCARCEAKGACRKWLDAHEVAAFAPSFCPNGDTFFEITFDQRGRGGSPPALATPRQSAAARATIPVDRA